MSEFKKFNYDVMIRESHLDTFGHVNNATYLELYEEARWAFITEAGYGLDRMKQTRQGPVILEVTCKYKKEITNREVIKITSETTQIKGKFMKLHQEMLKADGTIASTADFLVGFFDMKERKLLDPPSEWLDAIGVS